LNRNSLLEILEIRNALPIDITNKWVIEGFIEGLDASNIVSITNEDGIIEYVNEKFCQISKYTKKELLGSPHNIVRHPDMPKEFFAEMWKTIKNGRVWQGVLKNKAKDGSTYIVNTTIVPIIDDNGKNKHYVSIRHDITDIVVEEKAVQKQIIDDLTGLYNRVKLLDDIDKISFPAISIINIDGFSEINDFYGLHIGDDLLISISRKLKQFYLEPNHTLYRLRGDEFAVLTTSSDQVPEHLKILDELLLNIRKEPFDCNGHRIFVSATSGSAFESDTVLGKANIALKHARTKKKPHQIYDASMNLEVKTGENLEWAHKIRDAINAGRIVSYYQPIFNMETNEIEKYEALVRLVDSQGAIISPWQFLDIAKKTRQYAQITKVMLKHAVEMATKTGYEISVNLSVEDLESDDILMEIDKLLNGKEIGNKIVFELTETEEVKNYKAVSDFINNVKRRYGSKIAIDDFGSGYSNFEHLLELDFDYLKIDGSIIQKLEDGKHSNILVEAIKAFTDKLEIKTIAEFVSTEEIFKIIGLKGINYAQGHFIGKPESDLI